MAKEKPSSLLANVRSTLETSRTGWWMRMPPEAQTELLEVRAQFKTGELKAPAHTLARAVCKACSERGWPVPGQHAVVAWLNKS